MDKFKRLIVGRPAGRGVSWMERGTRVLMFRRQGVIATRHCGLRQDSNGLSATLEHVRLPGAHHVDAQVFHDGASIMAKRFAGPEAPPWLVATRSETPLGDALDWLGTHLGVSLAAYPDTLAYSYSTSYGDHGGDKDVLLSPFVFEAATDTIRLARENVCLVHFQDGQFDRRDLQVDPAAKPYLGFIEAALAKGFHSCDRRQGDAYLKRRLAWLAGEYAAEEIGRTGEVAYGLLNLEMEWPALRANERRAA